MTSTTQGMDRRSDIELGPFDVKKNVKIQQGSSERPQPSRRDVGQAYGHSTGSSGRRNLDRKFDSLSILALSVTLLASWESLTNTFVGSLLNGGPTSLVWGLLLSLSGTLAIAFSLAEMASICPIAGAQYHWTALFAPPGIRPFITWMQGWATVFAWQCSTTSIFQLMAKQVQGLIILNNPDYDAPRWQCTLLMWAFTAFSFAVNVWGIQLLPVLQLFGGIFHVVLFIVLAVPLILLSKRSTPEFVFTSVVSNGGWDSGVAWCIGMLTVTYCFLGFDGAVHMSEEVRNPSKVVPRIIVQSMIINGVLAFGFMLILLFFIGDINAASNPPSGLSSIAVFYTATKSTKATTAMQCSILLIGLMSSIGVVASVSRLTWAFARDGGLPFSKFFAHIDRRFHVPFRSIGLVSMVVVLLSLINIGSSTALNAILALTTCSLYTSYLIPIVLLVIRRFDKGGTPIQWGPWTMGPRVGLVVNIYAIVFGIFVIIFVPFPTVLPVTAENMNYSGPVYIVLTILLVIDWFFRGKQRFQGPLREQMQKTANA